MTSQSVNPTLPRLLLVDDELPIRDSLGTYFRKHGYDITTVATCYEATTAMEEGKFDVVVLDVMLPDGDGLSLLESFRAEYPNVPVIIISGLGFDEQTLRDALDRGAVAYVGKSLPLQHLLDEVQRALTAKPTAKSE
jgi:DNA-binding response OmpR family regulator